jgi:hypothetical protein
VVQRASRRKRGPPDLQPTRRTHNVHSDGPARGAKTAPGAFALLMDAESSGESFRNDDRSSHVLMTFAAEYIT